MHNNAPATGRILAVDLQNASSAGIPALLADRDTGPEQWRRTFLAGLRPGEGLESFLKDAPDLEAVVACSIGEPASHRDAAGCRKRMAALHALLAESGGIPCSMLQDAEAECIAADMRAELARHASKVCCMDACAALANALLATEKFSRRCFAEGCTVLLAGPDHVQAFLLYEGRILGVYEQHAPLSPGQLAHDLHELRLNWLPSEQVLAAGGHGCICGSLPAEAEAFIPTWISGPRAGEFKESGRIAPPSGDVRFDSCMGAALAVMHGGGEAAR